MKKKYIEISTENIEKYVNRAKENLSFYIACKKEYLKTGELYKNRLNIVNEELANTLIEINNLIDEIRILSKKILSLEKGEAALAYNHNQLLGNKDKNTIAKINSARYYYNEIKIELNKLISYRDELRCKLKLQKAEKSVLVKRKKKNTKGLNSTCKNIDICNYNMDKCYNVLDRLDKIYLKKIDKVNKSYIKPKVKKLNNFSI